jgi:hypothetical protein
MSTTRPDATEPTPPRTEDSAERGVVERRKETPVPAQYRDLGPTEEVEQDDIGDIADEGHGHRG